MSISEVARLTGLSIHTLRYYDECGLLPQVQRTASDHRQFDETDLDWIDILKCLRATEMPLADIQRFTELVQQGMHTENQKAPTVRQSGRKSITVQGKLDRQRQSGDAGSQVDNDKRGQAGKRQFNENEGTAHSTDNPISSNHS